MLDADGLPFEGVHAIVFRLFDAPEDGGLAWMETQAVEFSGGYYSVIVGTQVPLEDVLFGDDPLWLEVEIDGVTLAPRHELV